ncbi:aldehyde dehydrogenase [Irpex lacteus]|nr:aldehyde dehydrogenase [Irpex lacteus]
MSTSNSQYASLEQIDEIYARVAQTWKSGVTRSLDYRRRQLLQLARMIQENKTVWEDAVLADLGKQRQECVSTELGPTVHGALHAAENLEDWARPEKPKVDAWRQNWDATIYPVPKGTALIISPWNFPIVLTLLPMVGAIAAGCPVVIKPSELTPTVSALLASMIEKYLDPNAYVVVQGAIPETTKLLELRWAHILYTGSGRVGRLVAAAAAKHVTPVTLELGGKSPVIICPDADLDLAARRVLFGKVQNSGQLCVTPDYVLVPTAIASDFKSAMQKAYASFFPTDPLGPDSPGLRLSTMYNISGTVLAGGVGDFRRRIATTIVGDVKLDDPLMEEELFGPILPIVEVEDVDEAISIVADRPSPLALYVFSNDETVKQRCLERTSSGSLIFNDTVWQIVDGSYFSKNTFDVFTHRRSYCNMPAEYVVSPSCL